MKGVTTYLLLFLALLGLLFYFDSISALPEWLAQHRVGFHCLLMGGLGGCLYCLRGVYLNACVKRSWDKIWIPWYMIRPITSCLSGLVSFIFMQAGMLILDTKSAQSPSEYGYLALAFIAGLNVDKFIDKLESLAKSIWGIDKSRASEVKGE